VTLALALTTLALGGPAEAQSISQISQLREQAVLMAREGRVDEGIAALDRLTAASDDLRVRYDLIVVLGWAGRHPDAVAWWDKIGSPLAMPDYVLQAIIGSLLRVADTARARTLSEHWQRQSPDQAQPLLAAAAVAERLGERLDALRYLGEAGLVGADAQRVRAEQARLLGQIGGHHGAFMLSPDPSWAQRADRTALQLRTALELAAPTAAQRQAPGRSAGGA
jgi:Flp pilus assembly protein TadD